MWITLTISNCFLILNDKFDYSFFCYEIQYCEQKQLRSNFLYSSDIFVTCISGESLFPKGKTIFLRPRLEKVVCGLSLSLQPK